MSSNKIPVGILGATGSVGQKFIQLLIDHPDFEIAELAASERSAGKKYGDVVNWMMAMELPQNIAAMEVKNAADISLDCGLVFSGLDASVAGEIEEKYAQKGYTVVSNSKNHRFDTFVPLLIPEVNPGHLDLLSYQSFGEGKIVTNPNCSTIGMTMALKPLLDNFGLKTVNVVTMQAISGAGFPGLSGMSIVENVIPFIGGEEAKMESEPLKILGKAGENGVEPADITVNAQCNRVQVIDGHMESVQVSLKDKAEAQDIIEAWRSFKSEPQELELFYAPKNPIHYFAQPDYPQPRLHRNIEKGMAVSVGGLRPDKIFDFKFTVLSHNTVRGAAGGAILCAELMNKKGLIA